MVVVVVVVPGVVGVVAVQQQLVPVDYSRVIRLSSSLLFLYFDS